MSALNNYNIGLNSQIPNNTNNNSINLIGNSIINPVPIASEIGNNLRKNSDEV